jgi:IPT/TIG domain-containing protein/Calx-beta domain-containing protein
MLRRLFVVLFCAASAAAYALPSGTATCSTRPAQPCEVGKPITFTIPAIPFPLVSVRWTFDDGFITTTTAPSITHTFYTLGSHGAQIVINGEHFTAAGAYVGYGLISVRGPADPVPEGIGSVAIVFSRVEASLPANVAYSTSNYKAYAGISYVATSGSVSFAAGETQKTISVPIIDNSSYDPAVAFYFTAYSTTDGYFVQTFPMMIPIIENDPPPAISFDQTSYVANENDGHVTVFLRRANDLTHSAQGRLEVDPSVGGPQYSIFWPGVNFTFVPNETLKSIDVPIPHDGIYQGEGTVPLLIAPWIPSTAAVSAKANVLVHEADVPALSINDVSIREGDSKTTATAVFSVTTNCFRPVATTAHLADGTAATGRDFGTVTPASFSIGGSSDSLRKTTISVPIFGNDALEKNRAFSVGLTSPNATALRSGTCTIVDDDVEVSPAELTLLTGTIQQLEFHTGEPSNADRTMHVASPALIVPPTVTLPAGATSVMIPVTGGEWGDFPLTITTPPELFSRTRKVTAHVFTKTFGRLIPISLVVAPGATAVLTADVFPVQAGPTKMVITSSDPRVVTVQSPIEVGPNGSTPVTITAKDPGRAVLTAYAGGTSAGTAVVDVIYGDLPVIATIDPAMASPSGTPLLIHGANFVPGCSVRFDGIEVAANYIDAQTLAASAPAHEPATVDVQVVCGVKSGTLPQSFTYFTVRRRGARHH